MFEHSSQYRERLVVLLKRQESKKGFSGKISTTRYGLIQILKYLDMIVTKSTNNNKLFLGNVSY